MWYRTERWARARWPGEAHLVAEVEVAGHLWLDALPSPPHHSHPQKVVPCQVGPGQEGAPWRNAMIEQVCFGCGNEAGLLVTLGIET